jgi:hypothetical protein
MRNWFLEISSYFRFSQIPAKAQRSIALILLVDLVLLGVFLRWAYVEHYHITTSVLYGDLRYSMVDGSFIELFGYFKEVLIIALAALASFYRPNLIYLGYTALFLVALLDDSLTLHETLGHRIGPVLGLSQQISEILVFGFMSLVPLVIILRGYSLSHGRDRRNAEAMLLGFGLLMFCAVVMDFVHSAVMKTFGQGDTALSLLEDGGELLSLTAILLVMTRVVQSMGEFARASQRITGCILKTHSVIGSR